MLRQSGKRAGWALIMACVLAAVASARSFTVVVYNVENLFDVDGVSLYDDYQPSIYGPAHLRTKLENVAQVLERFNNGNGPDVILFQEIEVDQTPEPRGVDWAAWVAAQADRPLAELLQGPVVAAEWAGVPAEAWLLKALAERGLTGYTVVAGDIPGAIHEDGNRPAIKCVTFTRFPVEAVQRHAIVNARPILETRLKVDGHPLHVFNLHWKSGAGDVELEAVRVQNARVLRERIDALLAADPQADIVIGGDFNSHYNQKQRYPAMKETGLNDVLRSQGNELAIRGRDRDLYNLWFELPADERGSDTYQGEWGTLMQLIVSRGLYDYRGIQYQDNSFTVARLPGLNVNAAGLPVRWSGGGPTGSGFSDHLPIFAHFRVMTEDRADRWMELSRPSQIDSDGIIRRINLDIDAFAATAITLDQLPPGADLRDGSWSGKLFRVEGESVPDRHPRVLFAGQEYEIYGTLKAIRDRLYAQRDERGRFSFYGELGTFKGRWQFVVRDLSWIE